MRAGVVGHQLRARTVLLDEAAAEFAGANGLSRTDVRALIALLDLERAGATASPTWSARELGMTTASVTVLIDRLARAGHVRRRARSDDRRRVDITVEDSAKERGWSFFGPLIDATRDVLDRRTRAEREVVDAFLDEMLTAVGRLVQRRPDGVTSGDVRPSA